MSAEQLEVICPRKLEWSTKVGANDLNNEGAIKRFTSGQEFCDGNPNCNGPIRQPRKQLFLGKFLDKALGLPEICPIGEQ